MDNQADDFETRMARYTYQRPLHPVRDYGIVLAGKTGCGKSSTGNTILGRTALKAEPSGQSVTSVSSYTTSEYGDRTITIVDTPGVHDNVRSDSVIKQEYARMAFLLPEGVHCFVICMSASDVRVTKETKQFLDAVKVSGHADFFDYCMLVYTKPESELCDLSLDEYLDKQMENPDMKSFLEKIGDRVLAVNNKAKEQREKTRNKDAIIAMVDKVIKDNIIKKKPIVFTNDTFKAATKVREKVDSVVKKENCHPSLVNAVIEAVVSFSSWEIIEENEFVEKVLHILCSSEQCENDGRNLVFKNNNKCTSTSVVTCKKHIKMIYEAAQAEISLFYSVLAKVLKHKKMIALAAVGAGAGTAVVVSLGGLDLVGTLLGLPVVLLYNMGEKIP